MLQVLFPLGCHCFQANGVDPSVAFQHVSLEQEQRLMNLPGAPTLPRLLTTLKFLCCFLKLTF
jgi:hypothetical protein